MPVECICLICSKHFFVNPRTIKRGGGKYCSRSCADKGHRKKYMADPNVFKFYFKKYFNLMLFFSKRYCNDFNFREDLFQHQCICLYRIISNGQKDKKLKKLPKTYFHKSLALETIKFARKENKYKELVPFYLEDINLERE